MKMLTGRVFHIKSPGSWCFFKCLAPNLLPSIGVSWKRSGGVKWHFTSFIDLLPSPVAVRMTWYTQADSDSDWIDPAMTVWWASWDLGNHFAEVILWHFHHSLPRDVPEPAQDCAATGGFAWVKGTIQQQQNAYPSTNCDPLKPSTGSTCVFPLLNGSNYHPSQHFPTSPSCAAQVLNS